MLLLLFVSYCDSFCKPYLWGNFRIIFCRFRGQVILHVAMYCVCIAMYCVIWRHFAGHLPWQGSNICQTLMGEVVFHLERSLFVNYGPEINNIGHGTMYPVHHRNVPVIPDVTHQYLSVLKLIIV